MMIVSLDRYSRVVLTALTVLCTVIAVELWAQRPSSLDTATAQVPDAGLQRKQQLEEMRRTNELLTAILDRLDNKSLKVVVQASGKSSSKRGD